MKYLLQSNRHMKIPSASQSTFTLFSNYRKHNIMKINQINNFYSKQNIFYISSPKIHQKVIYYTKCFIQSFFFWVQKGLVKLRHHRTGNPHPRTNHKKAKNQVLLEVPEKREIQEAKSLRSQLERSATKLASQQICLKGACQSFLRRFLIEFIKGECTFGL